MNNSTAVNQNFGTSTGMVGSQDAPISEINSVMNQQVNIIDHISKTLENLFTRLAPVLSASTPNTNSEKQAGFNSPLASEISNNNSKLWIISSGLDELANRLQL